MAALLLAVAAGGIWWQHQSMPEPETTAEDLLPVPPVPPRIAEGEDYDKCLSMLNGDPSGAVAFAETWAGAGGGEGAAHCHALAQIALGDPETGADALDRLARSSRAIAAARATIYAQAGRAWIMAGNPVKAFGSTTHGLALNPDDPDLLVDHAVAGAALERYAAVVQDLTHALGTDPRRGDALVLRATARRHLEQFDLAQDDVDRAVALDPDDPDALLERGILRQRHGDQTGARRDWERAAQLSPDTATGDLAEQNLALLDAGPERR